MEGALFCSTGPNRLRTMLGPLGVLGKTRVPWPHLLLALLFAEPTYFGFPAKVGAGRGPKFICSLKGGSPFATSAEEIVVWSPTCKCGDTFPNFRAPRSGALGPRRRPSPWHGCTGGALRRLRTLTGPRPRAPTAPCDIEPTQSKWRPSVELFRNWTCEVHSTHTVTE